MTKNKNNSEKEYLKSDKIENIKPRYESESDDDILDEVEKANIRRLEANPILKDFDSLDLRLGHLKKTVEQQELLIKWLEGLTLGEKVSESSSATDVSDNLDP